jgi:hypothetical protein
VAKRNSKTAEIVADAPKAKVLPGLCIDGCGRECARPKARFVWGHDARIKSLADRVLLFVADPTAKKALNPMDPDVQQIPDAGHAYLAANGRDIREHVTRAKRSAAAKKASAKRTRKQAEPEAEADEQPTTDENGEITPNGVHEILALAHAAA